MKPKHSHAIEGLENMPLQVDLVELSSLSPTNVALAIGEPGHGCQTIIRALSAFVLLRPAFYLPEIDKRCVLRSNNSKELVVWRPGEKRHFKITGESFLVCDGSIRRHSPNDDCFIFRACSEMCARVIEAAVVYVSSVAVEGLNTF